MDTPHNLFREITADTGDQIAAIRAIRQQFGLGLLQAKEVMHLVEGSATSQAEQEKRVAEAVERIRRDQAEFTTPTPPQRIKGEKSLLDEGLRPSRVPDSGLAILDLIAALEIVRATPEVRDKRILGVRLHPNGVLYVTTGEPIGGYRLALAKVDGIWRVAEIAQWIA